MPVTGSHTVLLQTGQPGGPGRHTSQPGGSNAVGGGPINWAKSLGPHHTHTADIPGGEGTLKQAVTLVGALGQGS